MCNQEKAKKCSVTLAVRVVQVIRLACAKLFPWKLFDSWSSARTAVWTCRGGRALLW